MVEWELRTGSSFRLNESGEAMRAERFRTAVMRPWGVLHPDECAAMPNHAHGIVRIGGIGAFCRGAL
jgi:hypothetical protein